MWVHLYAQGTAQVQIAGRAVNLHQVTQYPWAGDIQLELGVTEPQTFTLHLRVPGWCEGWQVLVNGMPVAEQKPQANGYLAIEREWHPGDVVNLNLEMPIQTVWANPAVRYLLGQLAISRGPLVYCLESVDHADLALNRISINPEHISSGAFENEWQEHLLGGVNVLRGKGRLMDVAGWADQLYRYQQPSSQEIQVMAIPYYAWDNRAPGEMRVWFRAGYR